MGVSSTQETTLFPQAQDEGEQALVVMQPPDCQLLTESEEGCRAWLVQERGRRLLPSSDIAHTHITKSGRCSNYDVGVLVIHRLGHFGETIPGCVPAHCVPVDAGSRDSGSTLCLESQDPRSINDPTSRYLHPGKLIL